MKRKLVLNIENEKLTWKPQSIKNKNKLEREVGNNAGEKVTLIVLAPETLVLKKTSEWTQITAKVKFGKMQASE